MFELEKKKFAQCLVDGMEDMKAAFEVFPTDGKERMKAANLWRRDEEVKGYINEILGVSDKEEPKLMSKEEHIEVLQDIFKDESKEYGLRERLVASEQIAKMQGFITEKKETNNINNKIIVVTRSATNEDWAKGIENQQKQLVERTIEIKQDVAND